jgi:protein-serine/threonine kinase
VDPIVQDIKSAEPPVNVSLPMDTKTVSGQDRKNAGSSANAAVVKDGKTATGPASNFFQATLHKMFHMDASDKSKSSWSSVTSESDEDHRVGSNDAQALAQRPRFQKLADGSHVHNLLPTKKVHRMHNLLRDFGLHVGGVADVPQRLWEHDHGRPSIKPYDSETTLTNKYGKCHKVIGKGAFGIVRIAHKTEPKVPGEKLFAVKVGALRFA